MKKRIFAFVTLVIFATLSGCTHAASTHDTTEKKLSVITTFYPMYEFTKAVVGEEAEVEMLIPSGNEPHEYEPSAKDMKKIMNADVFVYNSEALEKWAKQMDTIDTEKTMVIEAAKGITLATHNDKGAKESDPHVWLDPVLAQQEVKTIESALSKKYPQKQEVFKRNADRYIQQLEALDKSYKEGLEKATHRTFVTQHAAFGYLAKRYNLNQEAVSGLSPEEEPSPSRLAELKNFVTKNGLSTIYFEENTTSKVAETLANETGVQTAVLNPIEGISEKEIAQGATYFTVMEENLRQLQRSIH